eukprot:4174746-Heterocapsa_arctica.AAC.1
MPKECGEAPGASGSPSHTRLLLRGETPGGGRSQPPTTYIRCGRVGSKTSPSIPTTTGKAVAGRRGGNGGGTVGGQLEPTWPANLPVA